MRRKGHRLQQLERQIAEGRTERAELRRRLEQFEQIAAAAGAAPDALNPAGTWHSGQAPSAPMPPGLVAAARELRSVDAAVRLDVAGTDVVAVVGGPGDPREWWDAIWQLAGHEPADPDEFPA